MKASVTSALGLSVGDVVRTSYSQGDHAIQRIWLYGPGEYTPYDAVTGIAQVTVDEPVVCLECSHSYGGDRHPIPSHLNGIVRHTSRWLFARYDWPPFVAPAGMLLFDAIDLRLRTAPPVIACGGDEVFLVQANNAPRQLDLFASQ